jgi:hypothetical protein
LRARSGYMREGYIVACSFVRNRNRIRIRIRIRNRNKNKTLLWMVRFLRTRFGLTLWHRGRGDGAAGPRLIDIRPTYRILNTP